MVPTHDWGKAYWQEMTRVLAAFHRRKIQKKEKSVKLGSSGCAFPAAWCDKPGRRKKWEYCSPCSVDPLFRSFRFFIYKNLHLPVVANGGN
jgi:hypothetical protein